MFPPRWWCSLTPPTQLPKWRCLPTQLPKRWCPPTELPKRRCPPTELLKRWHQHCSCSSPRALAVRSGPGAHGVSPALVPVAASVSRPSSTSWAWPPHPSPDSAPSLQFPLSDARERLEDVPLRGVVSGVQARRPPSYHQRSPSPFPLGLIYPHSTHLCTHSSHSQLVPIITVDYLFTSLPSPLPG